MAVYRSFLLGSFQEFSSCKFTRAMPAIYKLGLSQSNGATVRRIFSLCGWALTLEHWNTFPHLPLSTLLSSCCNSLLLILPFLLLFLRERVRECVQNAGFESSVTRWLSYFSHLASCNTENWPSYIQNYPKAVSKFCLILKHPNNWLAFWIYFAKVAKFRPIWSHCLKGTHHHRETGRLEQRLSTLKSEITAAAICFKISLLLTLSQSLFRS